MHGVMFKRLGHNVRILEQSTSSSRDNTAAGMSTGPNGKAFLELHDLDKRPYSFPCPGPQFVDSTGKVTRKLKMPLNLTSWDTLYHRLRANFDGLSSGYCPDPPDHLETDGKAVYDLGKRVTAVTSNGEFITVSFDNLLSGGNRTCHANLVIAADGANSTVRGLLAPKVQPRYAGYVAWRGTVPEEDVSEETRTVFDKGLFVSSLSGDRGYMVGYVIHFDYGYEALYLTCEDMQCLARMEHFSAAIVISTIFGIRSCLLLQKHSQSLLLIMRTINTAVPCLRERWNRKFGHDKWKVQNTCHPLSEKSVQRSKNPSSQPLTIVLRQKRAIMMVKFFWLVRRFSLFDLTRASVLIQQPFRPYN